MLKTIGVVLVSLLLAGKAFAGDVYTCEIDGHKVFSQQPCGGKVETVKNVGDRSVVVSLDMPQSDVSYLCSIAMRGWDSAGDKNSRITHGVTSYNYEVHNNGGISVHSTYTPPHSTRDIRDFIISHVSNTSELSSDNPPLYHLVSALADNYSVNNISKDATAQEYDAQRNMMQSDCMQHFSGGLSDIAHGNADAGNGFPKQKTATTPHTNMPVFIGH